MTQGRPGRAPWRRALRAALAGGTNVLGTFVKSADPQVAEILALAGFDVLVADLEHSTLGAGDVAAIVRAAEPHRVPVLVRIGPGELGAAGRLLETGAIGVQVTGVADAATLAEIRQATRFAPEGARSLATSHRAAAFGALAPAAYLEDARAQLVTVAQIESRAALAALPDLLASPDAPDVWFIGPFDLSSDLGHPGELEHPDVAAAMDGALGALRARRAIVGVFARDGADALEWRTRGAQLILLGSDVTLLAGAAGRVVRSLA